MIVSVYCVFSIGRSLNTTQYIFPVAMDRIIVGSALYGSQMNGNKCKCVSQSWISLLLSRHSLVFYDAFLFSPAVFMGRREKLKKLSRWKCERIYRLYTSSLPQNHKKDVNKKLIYSKCRINYVFYDFSALLPVYYQRTSKTKKLTMRTVEPIGRKFDSSKTKCRPSEYQVSETNYK